MRARLVVSFVVGLSIAAGATPARSASRKAHQLSCKQVREAVAANHTLEQLTAEFDTDAQHVMRCLQSKGKKKSSSRSKGKPAKATHTEHLAKSGAKQK